MQNDPELSGKYLGQISQDFAKGTTMSIYLSNGSKVKADPKIKTLCTPRS